MNHAMNYESFLAFNEIEKRLGELSKVVRGTLIPKVYLTEEEKDKIYDHTKDFTM